MLADALPEVTLIPEWLLPRAVQRQARAPRREAAFVPTYSGNDPKNFKCALSPRKQTEFKLAVSDPGGGFAVSPQIDVPIRLEARRLSDGIASTEASQMLAEFALASMTITKIHHPA